MNKLRLIPLLLCFVMLCSCTSSYESVSFFSMDTYMELSAKHEYYNQLKLAESEIGRLSSIFDSKNESELTRLNQTANMQISDDLAEILALSLHYANETNGAFNPAMYPVISLWNINPELKSIPAEDKIKAAYALCDYKNILLNGNSAVLKNGAKIDLGAIAKGYASQKAVDLLKANGVDSAMLSLGGNVALIGSKNGKTDWTVAIQSPRGSNGTPLGTITASDCFVVTSGDYQRYAEINGKRYHHIFGKDGYPSDSGLISVTVITDDGSMADAYSTALFVMGLDDAMKFYRQKNNFEAIFVTSDKKVVVTDGLKNNFKLMNGDFSYEN